MFLWSISRKSGVRKLRVIRTLFDYTRSIASPAGGFGLNRIVVKVVRESNERKGTGG
jgi:hypothetical protein